MELKKYHRENCVAVWSNSKAHGQLLACASPNTRNSALYDLEILSVDLADPSKNLQIEGKSMYNTEYRCLAWGAFGESQGSLPYGLIFGGMENGSFTLWNPAEMMNIHNDISQAHIDDQNSFIYAQEPDQDGTPIMCAQWNSLKSNYLAYGSTSLLILDVAKDISPPDILKPSSSNPHEGTYITSVAWNKQVPHVLASAGSDGLIALYDIKTNKSIFSFRDNTPGNNTRQVEIAWSKRISTQIAVTLDDEKKNELQIWDFRNQKGPIVVIDKGHSKGINSMDWSELDEDLILTASRDNKLCCWNYKQDEEPLSTRKIQSDIVKVAWAKNLPSIYSITTTDGLSICSLDDRNIHSYIPKWLKVPSSSTFNGNDTFITYAQERGNNMIEYSVKVQVKKELMEEIAVLEEFIEHENVDVLKDVEGETGQFWKLISTKKHQEGDADIYDFLGLNKDKIIKDLEKYTGKKRDSFTSNNNLKSSKKTKTKVSKADYIPVSVGQAASFFGSLSTEPLQKSFIKNEQQNEGQNIKYDMVPRNFNWDMGKQKLIKENMLIGNYEGAIDAALKCGRTAEALIIAYSIDQTTFNSTLKTFFTETTDKFISGILKHIAFKDSEELVKKYDLDKWKECVALIYSLSSAEKRKQLLSLLAHRLQSEYPESKQHRQAAIYCYILAEQFQNIVTMYQQQLDKNKPGSRARKLSLVILGTRLLAIYSCLTVNVKISHTFQRIVRELALVCLEVNKKLLSYSLLTTYVAASSGKYINCLIQNTADLSKYRNQAPVVLNLPVMSKRQEKTKKSTKTTENVEEVPTNIKAPGKGPRQPKTIAFDDGQAEDKGQKKKGPNTPPPPPTMPFGAKTPVPPPPGQGKKNVPPPPPSHPKKVQQYEQEEEEQQPQESHRGNPPNFPAPKKGGVVPPPPPPPRVVPRAPEQPNRPVRPVLPSYPQKEVEQEQQLVQENRRVPTRNVPPPPPPPSQIHHKEEPAVVNQPQRGVPPPPPGVGMKKVGPPPPPPSQIYREQPEQQPERQEKQERQPSRPVPTPPSRIVSPPMNRNLHPPPQKAPKVQQPEYSDEPQEQEQPPVVAPKKTIPTPPPVKKTSVPPPPPVKQITRVESQQSEEQEQTANTSFSQRRGPPPPPSGPARKGPPPPPPRR